MSTRWFSTFFWKIHDGSKGQIVEHTCRGSEYRRQEEPFDGRCLSHDFFIGEMFQRREPEAGISGNVNGSLQRIQNHVGTRFL